MRFSKTLKKGRELTWQENVEKLLQKSLGAWVPRLKARLEFM